MNLHQRQKKPNKQKSWDSRPPWLPPYQVLPSPLEVCHPRPRNLTVWPVHFFFPTQCILANAPAGMWSLQPTPVFYDVETLDLVPKFGQRPGQIVKFKIVFIERAHGWLCRTELGALPVGHHHAVNLLDSLRASPGGSGVSEGVPFPTRHWMALCGLDKLEGVCLYDY